MTSCSAVAAVAAVAVTASQEIVVEQEEATPAAVAATKT